MSFATYQRLRLHVTASEIDVVRAARKMIKPSARKAGGQIRIVRHGFYRDMLAEHAKACNLYRFVMRGN